MTTSGSNRTIVGLKPWVVREILSITETQQSHHCGIETRPLRLPDFFGVGCSNRTIVGLKRCQGLEVGRQGRSSNRTIVGLKHIK